MIESIEGAIIFLGCSLLISVGMLSVVAAIVAANNIIARYWKKLNWLQWHDPRPQYLVPEVSKVEPQSTQTQYKTRTKETVK